MYAYAGRAYICRMYAPSMLFPPTQLGAAWSSLELELVLSTIHYVVYE
jgi:hypothetical protein